MLIKMKQTRMGNDFSKVHQYVTGEIYDVGHMLGVHFLRMGWATFLGEC